MPDIARHISVDPEVCGGRPCIRGTRIRVVDILSVFAAGATRDESLKDYPRLTDADIAAALACAARQMDHPVIAAE